MSADEALPDIIDNAQLALESSTFVSAVGCGFSVGSRSMILHGANCYYLGLHSDADVEEVFQTARKRGYNCLRTWAFHKSPELLDRTIFNAERYGIRLILPLVNYWDDFGGVNGFLARAGLAGRANFFIHADTRQAYRDYVESLFLRTNTRTGRQYRDEPSILAWELANEPRCEIEGGCEILFEWVVEMSSFVKSIDFNHLLGVGDEGYFRRKFAFGNKLYNGFFGVDCEGFLSIPSIDFGTCHLYPHFADRSDKIQFGRRWIEEHIAAGRCAGKPMIVEEFGWRAEDGAGLRETAFAAWMDQVVASNGAGSLVWMIAGRSYPDYDGYTVYS